MEKEKNENVEEEAKALDSDESIARDDTKCHPERSEQSERRARSLDSVESIARDDTKCHPERSEQSERSRTGLEENCEKEQEMKTDFESQYIRLSADFQNYKKRSEKEKTEIFKSANARLITDMLPLIDDFDRALSVSENSTKETFIEGIELIIKRFAEILCKEGLEYIDTTDAVFDPNLHHAVMMEPSDEVESGMIIKELQKGYKVNGRVVRPSMVIVAE